MKYVALRGYKDLELKRHVEKDSVLEEEYKKDKVKLTEERIKYLVEERKLYKTVETIKEEGETANNEEVELDSKESEEADEEETKAEAVEDSESESKEEKKDNKSKTTKNK